MAEIRSITISGFRGIKSLFSLDFVKNGSIRSMVIYGRNGTGKSSLTDAWEWFTTEKIEHLKREGAGFSSFPNITAENGETYVEICFDNSDIGRVNLLYDNSKITKPIRTGNIEKFYEVAPHPCHIRFEDLTRFVYFSKTERFDALAQLMGFLPQAELQKSLRRVLRSLRDHRDKLTGRIEIEIKRLKKILSIENIENRNFITEMNSILERNGLDGVDEDKKLFGKGEELNSLVINDPKATRINDIKNIQQCLDSEKYNDNILTLLSEYNQIIPSFLSRKDEFSNLLLIKLFEQGTEVLTQIERDIELQKTKGFSRETDKDICPLCGQFYPGNLRAHIAEELDRLTDLKNSRDEIEMKRKAVLQALPNKAQLSLSKLNLHNDQMAEKYFLIDINSNAEKIEEVFTQIRILLQQKTEKITESSLSEMSDLTTQLRDLIGAQTNLIIKSNEIISTELTELNTGESDRSLLVEDNLKFRQALECWNGLQEIETQNSQISSVLDKFNFIVEDFITESINNVQDRFTVISNDLKQYFNLLEEDTEGLEGAVLKLLPDEDRAVELQIDFHGDSIFPAYKYLSESQLNSFGLAVFLASAKYFNSDFKFIILDDVINSFDGYKRPKVIELLKQELPEHQFLILTHDNVWCDRLFEAFPSSIKKRFIRWEYNHGPVDLDGCLPLEKIQQLINNDEPVEAGRNFGPFLERQLQEICENFEVLVKYTKNNEHTLAPLLERLLVRVKEKLGRNHPLFTALTNLSMEAGFRNLCSHWKNPDIQLTKEEIQRVMDCWIEVENQARCQNEQCLSWVTYQNSTQTFICQCGEKTLNRLSG